MTTFQIFIDSGHYESPQLKLDVDQEGSDRIALSELSLAEPFILYWLFLFF